MILSTVLLLIMQMAGCETGLLEMALPTTDLILREVDPAMNRFLNHHRARRSVCHLRSTLAGMQLDPAEVNHTCHLIVFHRLNHLVVLVEPDRLTLARVMGWVARPVPGTGPDCFTSFYFDQMGNSSHSRN